MSRPVTVSDLCSTVEALSPDNPEVRVPLAVSSNSISRLYDRAYRTAVAQLLGIVAPGMSLAKHAFSGLKRPMHFDGDMEADKSIVVYAWKPDWDFEWRGSNLDFGCLDPRVPPPNRVFTVLVRRRNSDAAKQGVIEHWTWVQEAPDLPCAPVAWDTRYESKLWSR